MREFDKSLRLVMPFVLLLICIFIFSMRLSSPGTTSFPSPFGTSKSGGTWLESGWESQINSVRLGQTDRIEITQIIIGDDNLLQLKGLDGLRELYLEKSQISDKGVAPLTTLRNLENLRIRGSRIRDNGFKQICTIASLKQLNLPQADLTDAGLELLPTLRHLELLRISSPRVTDIGVQQISRVASLRWIHLIDIPITDAAIKPLSEMRNLESLYLDGARVSDTAYDQLFRSRPDLHVHINQLHHDRDPHKADHAH